jgi:hypothetical protein
MPVKPGEKGHHPYGVSVGLFSPPEGLLCFIYDKAGDPAYQSLSEDYSEALQTDGYTHTMP